ncbi:MAG: hypothetical protein M2R45_04480 [Verrucomicrobia subdivision 3 bacterium]|nr:hypothetical protein [Limisphaerales bacterium]MCS1412676.1 hypothetical protein [Limisphaerales bacterium]
MIRFAILIHPATHKEQAILETIRDYHFTISTIKIHPPALPDIIGSIIGNIQIRIASTPHIGHYRPAAKNPVTVHTRRRCHIFETPVP